MINSNSIAYEIEKAIGFDLEGIGGFDGLINLIDDLTPEEKAWAKKHLVIRVVEYDPLDDDDQIQLPEPLQAGIFIYDGDTPIRDISDYIREEEERKLD